MTQTQIVKKYSAQWIEKGSYLWLSSRFYDEAADFYSALVSAFLVSELKIECCWSVHSSSTDTLVHITSAGPCLCGIDRGTIRRQGLCDDMAKCSGHELIIHIPVSW